MPPAKKINCEGSFHDIKGGEKISLYGRPQFLFSKLEKETRNQIWKLRSKCVSKDRKFSLFSPFCILHFKKMSGTQKLNSNGQKTHVVKPKCWPKEQLRKFINYSDVIRDWLISFAGDSLYFHLAVSDGLLLAVGRDHSADVVGGAVAGEVPPLHHDPRVHVHLRHRRSAQRSL